MSKAVIKGGLVRSLIADAAEEMTRRMIDIAMARNGFADVTTKDSIKAYEVLMSRAFGAPKQTVDVTTVNVSATADTTPLTLDQLRALERTLQGVVDGVAIDVTPVPPRLPPGE